MVKKQNQTVTLTPHQTTFLLHSVLSFLERSGFSKTLKRFLSEAQIQDDNWKNNAVDLENIYIKYLETCNPVDKKCGGKDVEPGDGVTQKDERNICVTSEETAKRKKEKEKKIDNGNRNAVMGQAGTSDKNSNSSTGAGKKLADDMANELNVISKDKKKSKMVSASVDQTEQNSEASKETTGHNASESRMDGSTKKRKERKESHSTSKSVDGTVELEKLDSLPEVTLKTKDKKKKSKVVDNEVKNGGQQPLENKKGLLMEKLIDDSAHQDLLEDKKPSKDNKESKEAAVSDGVKAGVKKKLTEANTTGTDSQEENLQHPADVADDKKGGSKKRKRLTNEENEDQHMEKVANEHMGKVANEESKRRKTEEREEVNNLEQQTNVNAENGQKASVEYFNENANNNIGKSGEKSALRKSAKKQLKGSAEPKSVNAFQRVKIDTVVYVDERLQDNSYWAKDGAEVGYGAKAQEVLGPVRGRDFRHEKTKKKRGSYRGGQIDLQSHSVKFNYSDEE